MKRAAVDHPATIRLARVLGISPLFALGVGVGYLDYTARHFPDGDLTQLEPAVLAAALGYPFGEETFWQAFTAAGFIEEGEGAEAWVRDPWGAEA